MACSLAHLLEPATCSAATSLAHNCLLLLVVWLCVLCALWLGRGFRGGGEVVQMWGAVTLSLVWRGGLCWGRVGRKSCTARGGQASAPPSPHPLPISCADAERIRDPGVGEREVLEAEQAPGALLRPHQGAEVRGSPQSCRTAVPGWGVGSGLPAGGSARGPVGRQRFGGGQAAPDWTAAAAALPAPTPPPHPPQRLAPPAAEGVPNEFASSPMTDSPS